MSDSPADIADTWLAQFSNAVLKTDARLVAQTFLEYGWLRDSLIFTWNNRALSGHDKIADYLRATLPSAKVSHFERLSLAGLETRFFLLPAGQQGVELAFQFQTVKGTGQGHARLLKSPEYGWKALTVFTALDELHGHPENAPDWDWAQGHTLAWEDVWAARRTEIEKDPYVIIIGAGQTGLQIAARFKQLSIPAIVVERNARVGDNWRERYPTLSLHTVRSHHQLLYQPFPKTWPIYTPRDKLADWFEQYAVAQDLVIWTKSRILPTPRYDEASRKWDVVVDHDGTEAKLHPNHIVLATGTLGKPFVPPIVSLPMFKGTHLHASAYRGGRAYKGKRVIVLGAGNTSADICQDLTFHGAASVTMIQRSSTCVVSQEAVSEELLQNWPLSAPIEHSDFKAAAMPVGLLKEINKEIWQMQKVHDKEMLEGLAKAGVALNDGLDNSGQLILVFARGGGYWIDVGVAKYIISGKVKMRQGIEVKECKESSVVFTDGSELGADVIVFATGYMNIRPTMRELFGDDVIDRTSEVYGLDDECELLGCYRPSGHPGLWYGAGDFFHSRYFSKQLGLLIQAIKLGILNDY